MALRVACVHGRTLSTLTNARRRRVLLGNMAEHDRPTLQIPAVLTCKVNDLDKPVVADVIRATGLTDTSQLVRYALVLTLSVVDDVDIDLYTPIANQIRITVPIDVTTTT